MQKWPKIQQKRHTTNGSFQKGLSSTCTLTTLDLSLLSNFIESYLSADNKRSWRFVAPTDLFEHSVMSQAQPTDSMITTVSADLKDSSNLPDYIPVLDAAFTWGTVDAHSFHHALEVTYQEVVHWRNNFFRVPHELARLFRAAGEGSALEGVAMTALCGH